jgi:uncharacterized protein (TIGR02996 family)
MSDGPALLASVLAAPDDDAPRLVLADWLDERGGPGDAERASFIRCQIELAKPPACEWMTRGLNCERYNADVQPYRVMVRCPTCQKRDALRRRERELLAANFGAWTDCLPESMVTKQCPSCAEQTPDYETNVVECRQCDCTGLVPDHDHVEFRRGFVASIDCTAADCLAHLDALLAAHPVEEVRLTTWPHWSTLTRHDHAYLGDTYLEDCRRRWPSVKTWHLPEPR